MANINKELLEKVTKYTGNIDLSADIITSINTAVNEFDRSLYDYLHKHIEKLHAMVSEKAKSIEDTESRSSFTHILGLFVIEETLSVLFQSASELSVVSKLRQSLFVFKAAEMFEMVFNTMTIQNLSSSLMDMILKNKPEPKKENLS